ncbi:hypothetical protein [Bradyrhizobium sp. LMG 9283]|uniref:hypothetical protein n=1 Tax=Bradyrhizobium sp. LMG 9283 TaxID=592064 RepID=UPI0038900888
MDEIDAAVPREFNSISSWMYATHKTRLIRRWLAKKSRWHVHLTPTSSSWLNQVERFFALLTRRSGAACVYRSVAALRGDIDRHNADPKPFR